MKKLFKILIMAILFFNVTVGIFTQISHAKSLFAQVSEILRNRIEAAGSPANLIVGDEFIHASIKDFHTPL